MLNMAIIQFRYQILNFAVVKHVMMHKYVDIQLNLQTQC